MDEQETLVLDRYPADALPEELRGKLQATANLRLVIDAAPEPSEMPLTTIVDRMRRLRTQSDDAVVRIRALRAENDQRDELFARIRAGNA